MDIAVTGKPLAPRQRERCMRAPHFHNPPDLVREFRVDPVGDVKVKAPILTAGVECELLLIGVSAPRPIDEADRHSFCRQLFDDLGKSGHRQQSICDRLRLVLAAI